MRLTKLISKHLSCRRRVALGTLGALALTSVGCYQPYYYTPPYPTYGGGPPAGIQTLTPGPSYVPGQVAPGGLQPIPNGSLGAPAPTLSPSPAQPTGPTPTYGDTPSNVPDYNPPPANNGNNNVPFYGDPGSDFETPEVTPNDEFEFDSFKPTGDPQAMLDSTAPFPLDSPTAVTLDGEIEIEQTAFVPDALTNEPTPHVTADEHYVAETSGETTLDPYGHEEGTYAWLRGAVHRDPDDGSWTITYDVTPEEFDPFAGHLTLADDPRLQSLHDDAVVLIEGRVNDGVTDRFGKPVYQISELVPLDVSVR